MKSMVWRVLLSAVFTAAYMFSFGATTEARADNCDALKTQSEITACFGDDEKAADSTLNKLYQSLMHVLSDADKQRLRDAQRAWISFRDKECTFRVAPYADGSIAPSLTASCVTALTAQRVVDLRQQVNCEEGDMSCVPHMSAATGTSPDKPAQRQAPTHGNMDKGACSQAVGLQKAKEIADHCLDMSGATHPHAILKIVVT
ncbi:DUF1311 domain-containing protein [Ochrobactrum oryzae]|nr:DUF1311 domain-containing protein [Brucella oryzae]